MKRHKYIMTEKPALPLPKEEQKQLDDLIMQALHISLFNANLITLEQSKLLENMNKRYWI